MCVCVYVCVSVRVCVCVCVFVRACVGVCGQRLSPIKTTGPKAPLVVAAVVALAAALVPTPPRRLAEGSRLRSRGL